MAQVFVSGPRIAMSTSVFTSPIGINAVGDRDIWAIILRDDFFRSVLKHLGLDESRVVFIKPAVIFEIGFARELFSNRLWFKTSEPRPLARFNRFLSLRREMDITRLYNHRAEEG